MDKKIALVTGSTSGIGKATALKLLEQNYFVIVSSEKISDDVDPSAFIGKEFEYMQLDISKKEQIIELADSIKKQYGKLDNLVNNAGIMPRPCGIENISDENIDRTLNVNLKGTFYSLKYLGKLIQETSGLGSIVNLTSVDGLIGEPYGVIYSTTKAGIISLTMSFARYYKNPLVRVNAIAPGLIDTPLTAATGEDPSWTTDVSVIQRMGTSGEIANSIAFLLSEEASFITGQVLAVDGGFTLK